eukprot:COSAG02_NODE_3884_length_6087_cov_11.216600_3_plen_367_part_00
MFANRYSGGVAVDALLRAGGDVMAAANLLAEEGEDHNSEDDGGGRGGKGKRSGKKGKKGGKKGGKKNGLAPAPHLGGSANPESDEDSDDGCGTRKKRGQKKGRRGGGGGASSGGGKDLSFKEKRQADVEARKAKRDARQVCRVCGGPHPRKECPGVMDGGRGQSRWHDQAARKKDGKQRRKQEAKEDDTSALHSIGLWTAGTLYYDAFADLHAVFVAQQKELGKRSSSGDGTSPILSPQRSPQRLPKGTTDLEADLDAFCLDGVEPVEDGSLADWTPPTTPSDPHNQSTSTANDAQQGQDGAVAVNASLLARWVEDWARLEAVVLDVGHRTSATAQPHQKLKKELLSTRLMKLQVRNAIHCLSGVL